MGTFAGLGSVIQLQFQYNLPQAGADLQPAPYLSRSDSIMQTITVKTRRRNELIEVTNQISKAVSQSGITDGMVVAFVPHTTAGITINENADPSVVHDILYCLETLIPERQREFQHSEGNSDSHIKASLVGSSVTVIVENGQLVLGTWQGIYFCEFDGPRNRRLMVKTSS